MTAVQLPFFGDMMGIIGALGFTPMDFVLPQFLWIAAYKPTGFKCALATPWLCFSALSTETCAEGIPSQYTLFGSFIIVFVTILPNI